MLSGRPCPGGALQACGVGLSQPTAAVKNQKGPRSSRIRRGRALCACDNSRVLRGGDSRRDGTVLWTGLVSARTEHAQTAVRYSDGGRWLFPLSSRYGPCLFGGVASGFCFVLAAVGLGAVSTQVIWRLRSPGSLALSHFSKMPRPGPQRGSIEPVWMESTNPRFGMSLPKERRRPRMVAHIWKNS